MMDVKVTGVDETIIGIRNVGEKAVDEVKPLIKQAATIAKKKSSDLAPTVLEAKGKTFKPRLPRSIRRRQSDQGLTQTIDINTTKAPHGYMVNALENNEMRSEWRRKNREKLGREGRFLESGGEAADDFLKDEFDNFTGATDAY